jgi:hypothetical protein
MDIAIRSAAFDESSLRIINQCRLHLNAVTVSDITIADGTRLIPGIGWGEIDAMPSYSNDHEPIQQAPAICFGHIGKDYSVLLHGLPAFFMRH